MPDGDPDAVPGADPGGDPDVAALLADPRALEARVIDLARGDDPRTGAALRLLPLVAARAPDALMPHRARLMSLIGAFDDGAELAQLAGILRHLPLAPNEAARVVVSLETGLSGQRGPVRAALFAAVVQVARRANSAVIRRVDGLLEARWRMAGPVEREHLAGLVEVLRGGE